MDDVGKKHAVTVRRRDPLNSAVMVGRKPIFEPIFVFLLAESMNNYNKYSFRGMSQVNGFNLAFSLILNFIDQVFAFLGKMDENSMYRPAGSARRYGLENAIVERGNS